MAEGRENFFSVAKDLAAKGLSKGREFLTPPEASPQTLARNIQPKLETINKWFPKLTPEQKADKCLKLDLSIKNMLRIGDSSGGGKIQHIEAEQEIKSALVGIFNSLENYIDIEERKRPKLHNDRVRDIYTAFLGYYRSGTVEQLPQMIQELVLEIELIGQAKN